jgi:hypothetical protein
VFRRISGSRGNATIFAKCSGTSIDSQAIPASEHTPNPDTVINATIVIAVRLALKTSTIPVLVSAPPTKYGDRENSLGDSHCPLALQALAANAENPTSAERTRQNSVQLLRCVLGARPAET